VHKVLIPGAFLLLATLPAAAQTGAGGACPRPAAGADVLPPASLFSANGAPERVNDFDTAGFGI